jgi:hypothetical protein
MSVLLNIIHADNFIVEARCLSPKKMQRLEHHIEVDL